MLLSQLPSITSSIGSFDPISCRDMASLYVFTSLQRIVCFHLLFLFCFHMGCVGEAGLAKQLGESEL